MKNKYGFVLTEALIAVGILGVGVVIMSAVVTNAISATKTSRDYLLAQNLTTEAVEAVKNIRDTNWLLRPNDKTCWLVINPVALRDPNANCATQQSAQQNVNYVVNFNSGDWNMSQVMGSDLNLQNGASVNAGFLLYEQPGRTGVFYGNTVRPTPSRFYRSVKFTNVTASMAEFIVSVQWFDGAKKRKIDRVLTIQNYL